MSKRRPIKIQDVNRAAGYKDDTMYRWYRNDDPRLTESAKVAFDNVLGLSEDEFFARLDKLDARRTDRT